LSKCDNNHNNLTRCNCGPRTTWTDPRIGLIQFSTPSCSKHYGAQTECCKKLEKLLKRLAKEMSNLDE
jgi:hypothetical protein